LLLSAIGYFQNHFSVGANLSKVKKPLNDKSERIDFKTTNLSSKTRKGFYAFFHPFLAE